MDSVDPNTPMWALSAAAAVGALVVAGYGVIRLFYYFKGEQLKHRANELDLRHKERDADQKDKDDDRKTEAAECWEVVKRLTEELQAVAPRTEALEKRCDQIRDESNKRERDALARATQCEAEHEGTKRVLEIVVAWGEGKGLKLPPRLKEQVLKRKSEEADGAEPGSGSDLHRPLQEGTQ